MEYTEAIILGLVQGITEWLPISSEAMVTLIGKFLFGFEYEEALGNAIWFHSGTLIAAIIYFRKDILEILKMENKKLLIFLLLATIATGIIAVPLIFLAFSLEIPDHLFTILIGVFLVIIAILQKKAKMGIKKEVNNQNALVAGLIQGLAVLPGFSRSGITIATLLGQKYDLKTAFRLSFLMSIPVTLGAQIVLPLARQGFFIDGAMVLGVLVSAVVGLLTIKILMEFAEKVNFFKATLSLGIVVILLGISIALFI